VQSAISVENISFAYKATGWALEPMSFRLEGGRILAVCGPNGSGKSTLLKAVAGLLKPDSGRVEIGGRDLHRMPRRELARMLGYLPQEVFFEFDFTVEQVVSFGRFARTGGFGFLGEADLRAIDRALADTGMDRYRRRPLSRLSGGERKRAMLASVLAQEPAVLLLDEPTASLDMEHALSLFEILNSLVSGGLAVLVVTHDLNLSSLFASNVLLLSDGKLAAAGLPSEVINEAVLKPVYGDSFLVTRHPQAGLPAVFPRWRLNDREGES